QVRIKKVLVAAVGADVAGRNQKIFMAEPAAGVHDDVADIAVLVVEDDVVNGAEFLLVHAEQVATTDLFFADVVHAFQRPVMCHGSRTSRANGVMRRLPVVTPDASTKQGRLGRRVEFSEQSESGSLARKL